METNCEKTMALSPGSRFCASHRSASSASIFVLDRNPAPTWSAGMRARMDRRRAAAADAAVASAGAASKFTLSVA